MNFKTHPKFQGEFQDPPKISKKISWPTQNFKKYFVTHPFLEFPFSRWFFYKTRLLVLSNFTWPTFQRTFFRQMKCNFFKVPLTGTLVMSETLPLNVWEFNSYMKEKTFSQSSYQGGYNMNFLASLHGGSSKQMLLFISLFAFLFQPTNKTDSI